MDVPCGVMTAYTCVVVLKSTEYFLGSYHTTHTQHIQLKENPLHNSNPAPLRSATPQK